MSEPKSNPATSADKIQTQFTKHRESKKKILIIGARMNHTLDENRTQCAIILTPPATIRVQCKPQVEPPHIPWPDDLKIWATQGGKIDNRITFVAGYNCDMSQESDYKAIAPLNRKENYFILEIKKSKKIGHGQKPVGEDPTTITIGDEPPDS